MSGGSDYICHVVSESVAAYERFLKKVLLHLPRGLGGEFGVRTQARKDHYEATHLTCLSRRALPYSSPDRNTS
jgi:hypothetical protein